MGHYYDYIGRAVSTRRPSHTIADLSDLFAAVTHATVDHLLEPLGLFAAI
jgi:hypothetical protein